MIKSVPAEQVRKVQALQKAQLELLERRPTVSMVNAQAVLGLDEVWHLDYRGDSYIVRPIDVKLGWRLTRINIRLFEIAKTPDSETDRDLMFEMYSLMMDVVLLFKDCVRPCRWRQKLRWWTRYNPFESATKVEIEELMDFFSKCRMTQKSVVRRSSSTPLPGKLKLTPSPISPNTSPHSGIFPAG